MENYGMPNYNSNYNYSFNNNYNNNFNNNSYYESLAKKQQKRLVRKKSNGLGFFVFAYILAMNVIYVLIDLIFDVLGADKSGLASSTSEISCLLYIFVAVFGSLIPGLIYSAASSNRLSQIIPTNKVKLNTLIPLVLMGMAVAMVSNFATNLVGDVFYFFGLENTLTINEVYDPQNPVLNGILCVVATAIVPAFAEEFAYRGIVMGTLRKYGDAFAVIASSVMFAAMHGNITQIPFAFILGLVFGFIDCKTNSIIPSIIMHFLNNFYSVMMDLINPGGVMSDRKLYTISAAVVAVFCLLGIISFIAMRKKDRSFYKIDNGTHSDSCVSLLTLKDKNTAFFTTPGVIISLVLFLGETIMCLGFVNG